MALHAQKVSNRKSHHGFFYCKRMLMCVQYVFSLWAESELSCFSSRIKEEKEKDDPKTIPLKVFGKGIGSCAQAVSKTLGVSNSDSTNEVVRLALQQFGVTVCIESSNTVFLCLVLL